jgi:autotransporter-associated beta strand protein
MKNKQAPRRNVTARAFFLLPLLIAIFAAHDASAQLYYQTNGTNATLTTAVWNTTGTGTFSSAWVSGTNVIFGVASNGTNFVTFATTTVGNITVNGNTVWTNGGTLSSKSGGSTVTVASGVVLSNSGSQNFSTTAGAFNWTKTGAGTWFLGSPGNAITGGAFTLSDGVVIASGANAFGGAGSTLNLNGGVLAWSGTRTWANTVTVGGNFGVSNSTPNNGALSGSVNLTGIRTITNLLGNQTFTISGAITNTGGLALTNTAAGTGSIVLSASNNFSGGLTLNSGVLTLSTSDFAAGTGTLTINGGAIGTDSSSRNITNATSVGGDFTFGTGTASALNGNMNLGGTNRMITIASANVANIFGGAITNGSLTVSNSSGSRSATFTNSGSSLTAFTALGGTNIISGSGSLGSSVALTVSTSGNNTWFDIGGLTGSGLTIGSLAGAGGGLILLGSKSLTIGGDAYFSTYGGVFSNTGSIIKSGTGTLTLTRSSSFSGGSVISGGVLGYGETNVLGTGTITLNGGALAASGARTITNNIVVSNNSTLGGLGSTITLNGNMDLANGTRVITMKNQADFGGVISNGSLTIDSTDSSLNTRFTLNNTATYTGATTINGGRLVLGSLGAISSDSALNIAATTTNAIFDLSGIGGTGLTVASLAGGSAGALALGTKNITVGANNSNTTFDGSMSGSGSLTKTGTGTLTIGSGNGGFSGATILSNGALALGSSTALGSGAITINGGQIGNANGSSRTLANALTVGGNFTLGGISGGSGITLNGNMDLGGATRTITLGNSATVGGVISNGGLTIDSSSTTSSFTMTNANTFANGLTINGGTNVISGNGSLASTLAVNIAASTTNAWLEIANLSASGLTIGSLTGGANGTLSLGAKNITLGGNNANTTFSGAITGAGGSITKNGTGTIILSGSNSYTGATTVNDGSIQLGASDRISDSSALTIAGGALDLSSFNDTVASLTQTGGTLAGTGTLTAATYALQGGTVTGNLGAGTATVTVGTTTLNGVLGAGTVNVNGGTLNLGSANRLSDGAAVTVAGGTFGMGTVNDTVGSFTMTSGTLDGSTGILTASSYALQGGAINAKLGSGAVTVSSGTTTLGSGARLNSSSALVVNSGQLTLGGNETVASLAGSGGSVALGANNLTASGNGTSTTFSGTLDGSGGSLTKAGNGTLILSGANTYDGTTTVSGGKLVMNGANTSSAVTVSSGGTLGGSGQVGALSVSGTLAPGNSVGTLSAGNTTFSGGGAFQLEMYNWTGSAGTGWDLLSVSGDLTLTNMGSPFAINLVSMSSTYASGLSINWNANANWTNAFVSYSGSLLGDAFSTSMFSVDTSAFQNLLNGTFSVITNGSGLSLLYTTSFVPSSTFTWTTNSGVWSDGANWAGNTAPANGDDVLFAGSGGDSTNNAVTSLNGMAFSNTAGSYTVTGNAFTNGALGIVNNSSSAQSVDNDIALGAAQTFNAAAGNLSFGGAIDNAGFRLSVEGAGNTVVSGALSGSGGLTKLGSGTLSLSGANTYSGGTVVSAGELSGDTTSLQGAITNNASVVFSQTTNGTYAGSLGGSGSLVKSGLGTVIFTGVNSQGGTTISGGTLQIGSGGTSGSLGGAITNNGTLAFNRSDNLTQGDAISGSGNLTKAGNGTLTLSGANAYSGGTLVSAGALSGDTTSLQGAITNNASVVFSQTTNGTYAGALGGSGSLVKSGAGAVILTGANSQGGTTISGGTLQIGNGSTSGSLAGAITNNGTLAYNRSDNLTQSSIISGSGILTKSGAGTLTLSGANAYSGETAINAGALNVQDGAGLGTTTGGAAVASGAALELQGGISVGAEALTISGTGISTGGALRSVSGNNTYGGLLTLGAASRINSDAGTLTLTNTGTITGATFGLSLGGSGNITLNSAVGTTSGTLTKDGTGTVVLAGANSYTGTTTVSVGVLNIQNATGLGTTAAGTTVASGAALELQGGISVGAEALTISGTGISSGGALRNVSGNNTYGGLLTLGAASRINSDAGTLTLANTGTIAGTGGTLTLGGSGNITLNSAVGTTGALTKDGTGTATLAGTNTYTGTTTVGGGTLALTGMNTGSGSMTVNSSGLLRLGQVNSLTNSVLLGGASAATVGTVELASAGSYTMNAFGSSGSGGGNLNFTNSSGSPATLTFTNANNYVTTGSAGSRTLSNNSTDLSMVFNGAVDIGSTANNDVAFAGPGNFIVNGAVTNSSSGVRALTKNGSGTLTLAGAGNYDGVTTINGGTLQVGSGSTSGALGTNTVSIGGGALLLYNRSDSFSVASALSGAGSLTKVGAGTLTLAGANSYNGGTLVSAGALSGDTTSLQGAITNNASVVFSQTTNGTYAGALGGSGSLVKSGAGAVILTGANSQGGTTISGGTLQIGSGGTSGSLGGAITNNGTLAFNRSDNLTQGDAISGSGNLTKAGNGTLTLSGAKTYSGGTLVSAGGLSGDTTSLQGTITNNGIVIFDQSTNGTYASVLSGTGALIKTNSATLVLTGANTQSGGTTIGQGTLQIGNGGATGSLAGAITNNGTLAYNSSANLTQSTVISGTGTLTKDGTGTVTLSGANTYSGGTLVSAGAVSGSTASLQGAITNNATVVMDQNSDGSYAGTMSGSGAFTKSGTGTVTLGGNNNSYNGAIDVQAGGLVAANNNALGSGLVTMANGSIQAANGVSIANNFTIGFASGVTTNFGSTTTLAGWDVFSGSSGVTNVAGSGSSGVLARNLALGTGVTTGTITNAVGGSGWNYATAALAVAANKFMGFGLSSSGSNTVLKLTTLDPFYYRASGTGPTNATLQYSLNGGSSYTDLFSTNYITGTSLQYGSIDLSAGGSVLQGVGTNGVLFRWVNYGASAAGGTWYLRDGNAAGNDLVINGQIGTLGSLYSGTGIIGINEAGSATFSGAITNNSAATLTAAANGIAAFSGIVSGAGSITKSGSGTVILSGANTYSGATTVSAGALSVSNNTALGTAAGGVTVADGAALEMQGGITVGAEALNLSGTGISSGGALRNLSGDNSYGGTITNTLASRINSDAGTLTLSGAINATNQALTFGGAGNISVSGAITNSTSTLTKDGSGTLTLVTAATHSGGTTLSGGTLRIGNTSSSGLGTGTLSLNGGILSGNNTSARTLTNNVSIGGNVGFGDGVSTGGITLSGPVDIGASTRTLTVLNTTTLSGAVSGSGGGLIKAGTGTIILGASNNFAGLTVNAGAAGYTNRYAFGTGTVTLANGVAVGQGGGMAAVTGNERLDRSLASDLLLQGNVTFGVGNTATYLGGNVDLGGSNRTLTLVASTLLYGDVSSGGLQLVNGSATQSRNFSLFGNNTYNGGTVVGTNLFLQAGSDNALGTGNVVFSNASGGTAGLRATSLSTNSVQLRTISNNIVLGSGIDVSVDGAASIQDSIGTPVAVTVDMTLSGVISGQGSLTKNASNTVTLSGANTYSGGTTIAVGTVSVSADNNLGTAPGSPANNITLSGGKLLATSGFTLDANRGITLGASGGIIEVASGQSVSYGGVAAGTGAFTKSGSGSFTFFGANTYSGDTTVSAGTLELANTSGAALGSTGSVSVTSGATLLISQNQQVNNTAAVSLSGGTIRTASGINETFGNLSVTGNSFLDFGTTSYANANTISFGTYTTSALLAVNNFNFGSTMTFSSNLSGAELATFSFTNGGIASSSWDSGTSTFTITAIPEPSTYLAAVGLIGLMLWPLRRRAAAVAKRF